MTSERSLSKRATDGRAGRHEAAHRTGQATALMALAVAELTSSLEVSMLYTALPTIFRDTGNAPLATWLITGFLLVQAATAAVGGRLGDLYGRRELLCAVLVLCTVGSIISATAHDLRFVIVGRLLQGASGAILPLCFGIVREMFGTAQARFWVSVLAGVYSFSGALGFVLGGFLAQYFGWRPIFYCTAIVASIGLPLVLLCVPRGRKPIESQRVDLMGGILFVPGMALLLVAVSKITEWGWLDLRTAVCLLIGSATLIVWGVYELRCESPLIDVRLLARRQILIGNAIYAAICLGSMQLVIVLLSLLQQPTWTGVGLGVSATAAGLLRLPPNLLAGVGAPIAGMLARRDGARRAVIGGSIISLVAWIAISIHHDSLPLLVALMCVESFGTGMVVAGIPNLILDAAPSERSSEATGVTYVVRAIFIAIGAQIALSILWSSPTIDSSGVPYPSPDEYANALAFITVMAGAAVILSFEVPRARNP